MAVERSPDGLPRTLNVGVIANDNSSVGGRLSRSAERLTPRGVAATLSE